MSQEPESTHLSGRWTGLWLALLAVAIALPRLGHTTPDSAYYIALADHFKGDLGREGITAPYAYRWVVPWLAARVPAIDSAVAIALCSVGALAATSVLLHRLLRSLGCDATGARRGSLVFICSFPALNYGGAVLTDSAGMLVLTAASLALAHGRFWIVLVALAIGAGVRESTLLLVPAMAILALQRRDVRGLLWCGVIGLAALAVLAGTRLQFADLPPYYWTPSWERFAANMTRPVSWATVLLTAVPPLALALPGLWRWSELPEMVRRFVLSLAPPALALAGYSAVAAFMGGRFWWPLYLAAIPVVAAAPRLNRPRARGERSRA